MTDHVVACADELRAAIERKRAELTAMEKALCALEEYFAVHGLLTTPAKGIGKTETTKKPGKIDKKIDEAKPGKLTEGLIAIDIDGKQIFGTTKQKTFVDAMSEAADCLHSSKGEEIWGTMPKFWAALKDLRDKLKGTGFEINSYSGQGYRLEKA